MKLAELRPEVHLYETQSHGVRRFLSNGGRLVLAHGTGTGKTLTSMAAIEAGRKRSMIHHTLVITPAGLRENYAKSVRRFTTQGVQVLGSQSEVNQGQAEPFSTSQKMAYTIVSYEMFRKDPEELVKRLGIDSLVVDEVHRAKNMDSKTFSALMKARKLVKHAIAMTASESSNEPADILPLLDFVTDGGLDIQTKGEFRERFTEVAGYEEGLRGGRKPVHRLTNKEELKELLSQHVDYIDQSALDSELFPKTQLEVVEVEMSLRQKLLYDYAMRKAGVLASQLVRRGVPPNAKDLNHVFSSLQYARTVSNSTHVLDTSQSLEHAAESTPKIRRVLDDVQKHLKETPDGQIIVYSNFIQGGADVVSAGLKARGVPFSLFLGKGNPGSSEKERQQAVEDYRAGKSRVMLVSGAGAEGLDLPNTTMLLMLDGHYSPARIEQAEARGVRSGGLSKRSPEQRVVQIRRYVSTKEGELTVDSWVYQIAERKERIISEFRKLLKETNPKVYKERERLEGFRARRLPAISLSPTGHEILERTLPVESTRATLEWGTPPTILGKPSRRQAVSSSKAPQTPEGQAARRQTKYLARWRGPDGEWRYRYPKTAAVIAALSQQREASRPRFFAALSESSTKDRDRS
jgi:superfamily II DNA or RNA helicase